MKKSVAVTLDFNPTQLHFLERLLSSYPVPEVQEEYSPIGKEYLSIEMFRKHFENADSPERVQRICKELANGYIKATCMSIIGDEIVANRRKRAEQTFEIVEYAYRPESWTKEMLGDYGTIISLIRSVMEKQNTGPALLQAGAVWVFTPFALSCLDKLLDVLIASGKYVGSKVGDFFTKFTDQAIALEYVYKSFSKSLNHEDYAQDIANILVQSYKDGAIEEDAVLVEEFNFIIERACSAYLERFKEHLTGIIEIGRRRGRIR